MKRITIEIKEQMVVLRKKGWTYPQIRSELEVSQGQCMKYLKNIKQINPLWITTEWKKAEEEAKDILI